MFLAGLPALSALMLVSLGLIPSRLANRFPGVLGSLTTLLCCLTLSVTLVMGVQVARTGTVDVAYVHWQWPVHWSFGVHVDPLAVVMLGLVGFIGLIIARYSQTYLLGDARQGQFFRWMSFTLGAVQLLFVSRNLVMFTAAWMLSSFGLHQLLTHYPDRSWAIWAARKKFLISRLGDIMLVSALALTYRYFGTTEYQELFAAAEAIHHDPTGGSLFTSLIGVLFVLGAMTKSAQFPFHSWLPDTMETPTPVSALMHAGVINAGGFLVIRLSPLVTLSPTAMDLLALIGGLTALMGSVIMLTQTSVKRSLAYSTIAQMGFMMLQCGLGAFSAALLHIVAHSAYKTHAFLSCGSVLDRSSRMKTSGFPVPSVTWSCSALECGVALAAGIAFLTFRLMGIDMLAKPGGLLLSLILVLALSQLLWTGLSTGITRLAVKSIVYAVFISLSYATGYLLMDQVFSHSSSYHKLAPSTYDFAVQVAVATGFSLIFALQAFSGPLSQQPWMRAFYVHAMNGFYIDIPARRLTAALYRQKAPVQ